jgi:hypothetical protein
VYIRVEFSDQTQQIDIYVFQKILNEDVIDETLILLIIIRNFSFRLIKSPELYMFCKIFNPESYDIYFSISKKIERL